MIFYILFLVLLILVIKHIYEIHNFNQGGIMEQLQSANKELIFEKLKERKPLLIHNLGNKNDIFLDLSFNKLIQDNPGHIIFHNNKYISLKSFQEDDIHQMNIYKNKDLCSQFRLEKGFNEIYQSFESKIHCNKNYFMSLFKGSNAIELTQNKHNLLLIHQIYGESKLYLFNPKHKLDIENKNNNNEIKKYGHKINLSPGIVVYIPIEWYYFYETGNESILGEIECDNYFTFIYNNLR
tara:strand:- start:231 stop:944 length:714 start_codon:yes stop_codon:yes gene_type:complete